MWTPTPPATEGWFWCRPVGGDEPQEPQAVRVADGYAIFGEDWIDIADTEGWLWWSVALAPPPA